MKLHDISSLSVDPIRQRGADSPAMAPGAIAALAESIEARGLMTPLVVELSPSGPILRAGERRLKAISFLYSQGTPIRHGGTPIPLGTIPIVTYDELSPLEAFMIEFEENEKREPLTWQEKDRAMAQMHALLTAQGGKTHSQLVREVLAAAQQVPVEEVDTTNSQLQNTHQEILVGNALSDPDIAGARTHREAVKILERKRKQREDALITEVAPNTFLGDCLNILPTFPEGFFDCVVMDPPYGVGISQMSFQHATEHEYDDSYSAWIVLMQDLLPEVWRVMKTDSHGYVFCAAERFSELKIFLEEEDFEVYSRPLIWNRSPDGRVPTPEKWPRRVYETIAYFRKGNRPLMLVRGDVLSYPADKDEENHHGARKPVPLFIDLIERSTRVGERVLDPFGGSGTTLRAGKLSNREAWVIEKDPSAYGLMIRLGKE